ncbi:DNA-directed RNA polymerase III complex subunit Rpc25 [Tilletia horrida]|nr:DNA-directed RNA polymerase III complex subunit Rpc25 [Tilletia horrida]KAK0537841.1 DNA-directed RNA polymerase III complex subunit Rpc25 [Tilletia horrida]
MFRLSEIEDTIRIEPSNMEKDRVEALTEEINRKYSNRVLQGVGLCMFLFDFVKAGEGIVRWGDGCLYHHCTFRMMVFRPFAGEVLQGRIMSANEEGIRKFFDDMYVPPQLMPDICAFDHHERAWFWVYQPPPDPETGEVTGRITDPYTTDPNDRLYLHVGEQIRFAVEEDDFNDPEPGPSALAGGTLAEGARIGGGAFAPPPGAAAGPSAPGVGPGSAQGGNVASASGAAPGEAGTGPTLHGNAEAAPVPAAFMEKAAPYIVYGLGHPGWWEDDQNQQGEGEADAGMEDTNGYHDGDAMEAV